MSKSESRKPLRRRLRRRVHELLEPAVGPRPHVLHDGRPNWAFGVEFVLVLVILVNSASLILWTVPELEVSFGHVFHIIEYTTVGIFLVEYSLRFWVAPEADRAPGRAGASAHPSDWRLRWRYIRSANALIDVLALAPSAVAAVVLLTSDAGPSLSFLLTVRLLTRTAKLARYFPAARRLGDAVRLKGSQLITTVAALLVALVIAAALMYFAETTAQPDVFPSIPAAMWWSVVTLTTVGYGDAVPVTTQGRALAAVIAVLGIGLFALPAGILSAGLLEADAADARRPAPATGSGSDSAICPHCGQPLPEPGDGDGSTGSP